jgi:L-ascorbate metabolism protein UlaG (beta-lactamase superfamily)
MSHIARCTTKLVNVSREIMDLALEQVAERHRVARLGVRVRRVPNARWSIAVPHKRNPWDIHGTALVALVEDAGGRLTFVYDTDYEQAAQALQAEIVQEYVALALKVALMRRGYQVQETAGQQGTRSIVGVMA